VRRAHEEQDDVAGGGGGRKGDGNGGEMSGDYGEGRRWGPVRKTDDGGWGGPKAKMEEYCRGGGAL